MIIHETGCGWETGPYCTCGADPERSAENDARSTHVVYRIGSDFSYQETPCFCPARQSHSILDTRPTSPGK